MTTAQRLLKPLRTLHLYLGVFTAPALLFIAFTGGLQAVNLHEAHPGSSYRPPAWLVAASHMHKKQTFEVPKARAGGGRRAGRIASAAAGATPVVGPQQRPTAQHNPWPMKGFFVVVALSLLTSTLTGLYMAWRTTRAKHRYVLTLAAGLVVPAVLMLL